MMRGQVADGVAGLFDGCDYVGDVGARGIIRARSGISQAASYRAKQRRAWMHLVAQLIRQVAHVGAHADGGGESVVGVALEVIEQIFGIEIRLGHAAVELLEESEVAVD